MTAGELIKELSKYDPDTPVSVGNREVYFVHPKPAYWDGVLQRLIVNESKKPYYCIEGVKFTQKGSKLELETMELGDIFLNDPNAVVEYDVTEHKQKELEKWVVQEQAEAIQIIHEVRKADDEI